jgi:outer membrane protein TolC
VAKVREQARGAGISTQARRDDAALRTALQYLEADRLRRAAEVARRQTESIEKMAEITRIRVAEGRELELENKRTAARLAQARHRARVLEGAAGIEEEVLGQLLGFPSGDQVRPIAEERPVLKVPDSEDEVARGALEASKDLRVLQSKMQAAGLDVKANQAARLPRIDLVAQYGLFARFNNYDEFFRRFQRHNGQLGVSFQLPILPGSAAPARAEQAATESARLRLEMAAARSRVSLTARRAYQDLKNAESLREVARLDLEVAREQLAVSMAQYEEGRAALKLVEDARILENERWMAFLDAQFSVEKLRLTVLKDTGDLLAALN